MAKMKKGSAAAKAWGKKMKALRNKPKSKKSSTKKGGGRKTVKRAYTGLKRKANKVKRGTKSVKGLKSITSSNTLKKVALGVGGAAIASAVIGMIAPQSSISRYAAPAGAYVMGGIEGIIGSMALSMFSRPTGGNANVAPAMEVL
jgi:hypothetical protein